jgi:MFS family permease
VARGVGTGSPLRNRPLLALISAEIVSGIGSHMTFLALPWFVLVTTGSPAKMGLVLAAELLPVALLGIPSGSLVTRLGGRTTMLWADALRAPLMLSIPLLHSAGLLSFPLLLLVVAGIGAVSGPYFASQRLVLPELLGDDETLVAKANSIVEGAQRFTSLLGPALAGVLIALVGAANLLYVDAATFLVSFLTVLTLVPARARRIGAGESGGMLAGLRFLLRDRLLGPVMLTVVVANMLWQALFATLRVLGYEHFESSQVTGAFFAASGAGALLGAFIAFRLVGRFDPLKLVAVVIVLDVLPIWLLGFGLPAFGIMAVLFVAAVGNPIVNAPMISILTVRTPEALRAKVMSAVVVFATVAGPLGLVAVGPALEVIGWQAMFFVIAAGMTAASLFFAWIALTRRGQTLGHVPAEPVTASAS